MIEIFTEAHLQSPVDCFDKIRLDDSIVKDKYCCETGLVCLYTNIYRNFTSTMKPVRRLLNFLLNYYIEVS